MRRNRFLAAVGLVFGLVAAACGGGTQTAGPKETTAASGGKCTSKLTAAGAGFERLRDEESRVLAQGAKKTFKIGFIGDLTGKTSNLVIHMKQAAQLAIEQANAAGDLPVKIEFVPLDNKDAVEQTAAPLAQKLANDAAVVGVVGPAFSGESSVADKILDAAGITIITPSATRPDLSKQGWKTFHRALSTDEVQGGQTAELLVKGMGCKKIAVVNDKSPYGEGIAQEISKGIKAAGGSVAVEEGIASTTDYTTLVDTLIAKTPDVIYYGGYQPEASLVIKQYREKGGKAPIVLGDGSKDQKLVTDAGTSNVDRVLITCPCLDPNLSTDAMAQKLAKDYKAKFGVEGGIYTAEGWDVAQIFVAAIKSSAPDVTRQKVLDFVNGIKDFKGVSKTFNWTPEGEVKGGAIHLYQVAAGKLTYLGLMDKFI